LKPKLVTFFGCDASGNAPSGEQHTGLPVFQQPRPNEGAWLPASQLPASVAAEEQAAAAKLTAVLEQQRQRMDEQLALAQVGVCVWVVLLAPLLLCTGCNLTQCTHGVSPPGKQELEVSKKKSPKFGMIGALSMLVRIHRIKPPVFPRPA
jgi:hypothetical protein